MKEKANAIRPGLNTNVSCKCGKTQMRMFRKLSGRREVWARNEGSAIERLIQNRHPSTTIDLSHRIRFDGGVVFAIQRCSPLMSAHDTTIFRAIAQLLWICALR